jgi:hypothetical protein
MMNEEVRAGEPFRQSLYEGCEDNVPRRIIMRKLLSNG